MLEDVYYRSPSNLDINELAAMDYEFTYRTEDFKECLRLCDCMIKGEVPFVIKKHDDGTFSAFRKYVPINRRGYAR